MYIDVHKAIRRLTPAPTAMLFRRGSASADRLNREQSGEGGRHIEIKKLDPSSAAQDGEVVVASPKTVTFMMKKRHSAGQDGPESSNVSVKANMDQLRQHLKHLGPSNPASNPKNTNSATVLIKPGLGAASPVPAPSKDIPRSRTRADVQSPEGEESDEETPLLASKMTPKDKDSPLASKTGYGAADSGDGNASGGLQTLSVKSDGSLTITPADDKDQPSEPQSPQQKSRSNTVTSGNANGNGIGINFDNPSSMTTSRSGGITESYIETGGVRKVVISASSGEEDEDMPASAGPIAQPPLSVTTAPATLTTNMSGETEEDGDNAEGDDHGDAQESQALLDVGSPNTEASSSTAVQGGGSGGGKKNKKKRKNKKK